jgi:hypothetical protein
VSIKTHQFNVTKKYVLLPILDALKAFKEENLYEFNKKIFVLNNLKLKYLFQVIEKTSRPSQHRRQQKEVQMQFS